jgi:glucosamine--fructose-6-phosphate aminotransferase (isomerizing)
VLSQSGETADTLAALRLAANLNYLATLSICNVPSSSITLEADIHFLTRAGIEIGVASTKAFTTQLISLLLLILSIAREKNKNIDEKSLIEAINDLPRLMREVINQEALIANWAQSFIQKQHAIFVARGLLFPIALEGALKMKEISYIHSEGYPAGELKHGPLALIDGDMPVIATVPHDKLFEKHISNLEEINARGGKLFILTDNPHLRERSAFKESRIIIMPSVHALLSPLLYTVPLQLLAYYVAILKGTDVDQPRNLAKSVTVE